MTSKEWEEINKIIKEEVKQGKKSVVRKMIDKTMTFNDCLTVLNAFSSNNGINTPATVETVQNKPVNGFETVSDNRQNQIERVEDTEIIQNDKIDSVKLTSEIMDLIHNYILISGLEDDKDLVKAPQRFFGAVCSYIGDNLIKSIVKPMKPVLVGKRIVADNSVDIYKLADCLKIYCKLCDKYNKAVMVDHAANFSGLSRSYLFNIKDKLTPLGVDLWKKREDSIIAGILDGKSGNITGSAIVLNHDYGYATNQTHTEKKETIVIYPSLSSNQAQSTPQINTTETKQVL